MQRRIVPPNNNLTEKHQTPYTNVCGRMCERFKRFHLFSLENHSTLFHRLLESLETTYSNLTSALGTV